MSELDDDFDDDNFDDEDADAKLADETEAKKDAKASALEKRRLIDNLLEEKRLASVLKDIDDDNWDDLDDEDWDDDE